MVISTCNWYNPHKASKNPLKHPSLISYLTSITS